MFLFIINHWRGLLPPRLSLIGVLVGGGVALHFLFAVLPATLPLVLMAVIILPTGLTLIWQITGTLRSCERNLKGGGDMILYWGCYGASGVVAVVMALNVTSLISTATGANLPPEPHRVELEVQGDTILIEGFIGFRTHTALLALLEVPDNPYTTLRLNSDGGRIFAARVIASTLILHDLNTEVTGRCASACTLIFLAGRQRHLLEDAQLGFHQYLQTSSIRLLDTAQEQQKDRAYFKTRGVSDAFIASMFQAEHQEIWFPDRATLVSAGILTD